MLPINCPVEFWEAVMHGARSLAVFVCLCPALFVAASRAQDAPEKAADDVLAHDLELLQGNWELFHGNAGGTPTYHSIKEIKGNQETLRRYEAKSGKLIREHTVEFTLARSGDVRVFTFYAIGADAKRGMSFVYKVDADNFYDTTGLLQGDTYRNYQAIPQTWHWKRVKGDAAPRPGSPEPPPRPELDAALRKQLELLGARVAVAADGYIIDIRGKTGFTDKEIDIVVQCPALVELTMEKTSVTDKGLEKLRPLKQLRRLILNDCAISSAGLEILADLPLRETVLSIGLRGTQIKEDDLKWLKDFSRLERIDASGTRLTDTSLAPLQSLPLKILNVADARFSAAALDEFQKQHPKLVIRK